MAKDERFDMRSETERLEEQRKEALSRQDAVLYYTLCEQLGMTHPEDEHLYNLGGLEVQAQEEDVREVEKENKNRSRTKYINFLDEIEGINSSDFSAQTDRKKEALKKSFPYRFRSDGGIDLNNMSEMKVGALFNKLKQYSIEQTR